MCTLSGPINLNTKYMLQKIFYIEFERSFNVSKMIFLSPPIGMYNKGLTLYILSEPMDPNTKIYVTEDFLYSFLKQVLTFQK